MCTIGRTSGATCERKRGDDQESYGEIRYGVSWPAVAWALAEMILAVQGERARGKGRVGKSACYFLNAALRIGGRCTLPARLRRRFPGFLGSRGVGLGDL